MNTRTCTKCQKTFPANTLHFHKKRKQSKWRKRTGNYSLKDNCIVCISETRKNKTPVNQKKKRLKRQQRLNREKPSIIYQIINKATGCVYIGESSYGRERRIKEHKYELRKQKHPNPLLQEDWNKYGKKAFIFEIIEELPCGISKDILRKKEGEYIKQYLKEGKILYNKNRRINV